MDEISRAQRTALLWREMGLKAVLMLLAAVPIHAQDGLPSSSAIAKVIAVHDGKRATGTGFVIRLDGSAAYLLSAAHVVAGSQEVEVSFQSDPDRPRPALTVQMDLVNDLVALRVRQVPRDVKALEFDSGPDPGPAESLRLLGFLGRARTPMSRPATLAGPEGGHFALNAAAGEGDSGGPVLCNGRVVAVVARVDRHFAYAVPAEIVRRTLKGWNIPFSTGRTDPVGPTPENRQLAIAVLVFGNQSGKAQGNIGKLAQAAFTQVLNSLPNVRVVGDSASADLLATGAVTRNTVERRQPIEVYGLKILTDHYRLSLELRIVDPEASEYRFSKLYHAEHAEPYPDPDMAPPDPADKTAELLESIARKALDDLKSEFEP